MKKRTRGGRGPIQEIVSLNDELFSFATGDPLAALDELLAMVAGGGDICNGYTCGTLSGCTGYTCSTFKIP